MASKAGCLTTHQILRLVEVITKGFNDKAFTPAIFLYVAKAYDSVWHTGLIYSLIKYGLPDAIIKLLTSYLQRRITQVKEGTEMSAVYSTNAGVPRGFVIGPLLYNMYVSDVPTMPETYIAQYADDTILYPNHKNTLYAVQCLQQLIDSVEKLCT